MTWLTLLLAHRSGFVHAEGFFPLPIARHAVRARAAPEADQLEFATAAFAFKDSRIAQLGEKLRRLPDLLEALLPEIARFEWKVAARLDKAFVRDEADPRARETTACHLVQVGWMAVAVTAGMT
jgi:hypothetical protein